MIELSKCCDSNLVYAPKLNFYSILTYLIFICASRRQIIFKNNKFVSSKAMPTSNGEWWRVTQMLKWIDLATLAATTNGEKSNFDVQTTNRCFHLFGWLKLAAIIHRFLSNSKVDSGDHVSKRFHRIKWLLFSLIILLFASSLRLQSHLCVGIMNWTNEQTDQTILSRGKFPNMSSELKTLVSWKWEIWLCFHPIRSSEIRRATFNLPLFSPFVFAKSN